MAIRLETFGNLKVFRDGAELIKLPAQRLRCALLVHLAIERSVPRERLLDLLWPSADAAATRRHNLSQMISELRQALGQTAIEVRPDQLVIGPDVTVDALDFHEAVLSGRAEEAVTLYRGAFLDETQLAETKPFEMWVDAQRERFAGLNRGLQRERVDGLIAAGDLKAALAAARRWVLVDPLEDDGYSKLIGLLARSGQRNEAMRHYEEYCSRLAAIDSEPLDSIRELIEGLRRGSVPVDATPSINAATAAAVTAKLGVVVFPIGAAEGSEEYLYEGLAEEVSNMLGRAPGLRVIPRASAFAKRPVATGLSAAARGLGATHAVQGSTRVVNGERRLQLKLIDTQREVELWSEESPAALTPEDVFALEDRIADRVLGTLTKRPRPATRRETSDPEAHALYLRGRHAWFSRTIDGLYRALDLFQEAVKRDPRYARAHAGISDVYTVLCGYDYTAAAPDELYLPARAAAERALEMDPDLSEAHAALANYYVNYAWDWARAEESFIRAIDLNPGYSSARQWYSYYLIGFKREDEAIAEATLALELDPRSVFLSSTLARHFQLLRQPNRAIEQYRRALEIDPAFPSAHMGLALAELYAGRPEDAIDRLEKIKGSARPVPPLAQALLAYAHGILGDDKRARSIIQHLKAIPTYLPPEHVAVGYIGLGEYDRALEWLEKAFKVRSQVMTLLNVEPIFDPLRSDPRFVKLLEAVGFKPAEPPPIDSILQRSRFSGPKAESESIGPGDTYYLPNLSDRGGSSPRAQEHD